jgi:hypothetical protein
MESRVYRVRSQPPSQRRLPRQPRSSARPYARQSNRSRDRRDRHTPRRSFPQRRSPVSLQRRSRSPESNSPRPAMCREVLREIVESRHGVRTITTTETFTRPMSHQRNVPERPQFAMPQQGLVPQQFALPQQGLVPQQYALMSSANSSAPARRRGDHRRRPQSNVDLLDRLRAQLAQVERTKQQLSLCL